MSAVRTAATATAVVAATATAAMVAAATTTAAVIAAACAHAGAVIAAPAIATEALMGLRGRGVVVRLRRVTARSIVGRTCGITIAEASVAGAVYSTLVTGEA